MKKSLLVIALLGLGMSQAEAQCPAGQTEVTVSITTDNYGEETSWTLTGLGGTPVYGSDGNLADATTVTDDVCVPDGAVIIFTIFDSYGDGICCQFGTGSYTVTAGGNTIVTGGEFETEVVTYFQTGTPVMLDVAALSIDLASVVAQGNQVISGSLRNFGTSAISAFTLNYSVDGGAPVSQAVNAAIAVGGSYNYSHGTPWNATAGAHTIEVWASNLNGGTDGNSVNDMASRAVNVATQSVDRVTVIEQFTSSTCPPCASLNNSFGPILAGQNTNTAGSNVAAIKYHLNYPSPGNDPSFNGDADARSDYYGVPGIPDLYIDGKPMTANSATYIQQQAARDAFVGLSVAYSTIGNQINVSANVTPYATFPGTHKLHIAIVENSYNYAASTTTQDVFNYVQRKMLANAQGNNLTVLTGDQTQTINQTHSMVFGNPAQGNSNAWGNEMEDLTIVAFVQNNTTKDILQAAFVPLATNVGISENALDQRLRVYPNPTEGLLNVQFEAPLGGKAHIEVFNVLGDRVFEATRATAAGTQREVIDLSTFNSGIYFVNITADGVRASRKVTLNK